MTESQFADDLALYTVTCVALESVGRKFVQVASWYGLIVSFQRLKD